MSAAKKIADKKILRELVPLNTLSQARFEEISGKIIIDEVRAGSYLFRIDDRDMQTVFLLGGEIELFDSRCEGSTRISADSDKSRFPIADAQPRSLSARALKKCVVARINTSLLDAFLSWDQSNDTEAVAIGSNEDDDWMTRMLQSRAFEKIPPAKIQQLLLKMDAIRLGAGDSVIRQGDVGDSFYTIKSGKCAVTRKDTPQAEDRLLAELADGDCFGEEALVLDVKRNATVSMLTDGVLMRLAKKDFVELLQKPLVRYIDAEAALTMVDEGAVWVDVRTADEYDSGALEDSVNIPLTSVRGEIPDLVFNVAYIICCDTAQRSASAAFILSHRGFDVYVLEDGLQAMSDDVFTTVVDSTLADPEVAARIAGYEQQMSTLHGQQQQLEAELNRAGRQNTLLEHQLDELSNLHEKDRLLLANDTDEHEQLVSAMQGQVRCLEVSLQEQLENNNNLLGDKQAAEDMFHKQKQEWEQQCATLTEDHDETRQNESDLQKQIEQAHDRNARDRARMQEELEELVGKTNSKIETTEIRCAELKHGQSSLLSDLEAIRKERDSLQKSLGEAIDAAAVGQNKIDALNARVVSVTGNAGEQIQTLELESETMRLQLGEANQQAADRLAQLNDLQGEIQRMREAEAGIKIETAALVQQTGVLEQSLDKARDDLTSKNETERELQGQIDRLRKKIEQTRFGHEDERDAAQVDIDSVREELHAERRARSVERAQMAARQRELKEQLAAVATEHETNLSKHSGAVEQARILTREEEQIRMQRMHEQQQEAENQLEKQQQELTLAHEEISALAVREKVRRSEENGLTEDREQQYEDSLENFRNQVGKLVQERDAAHSKMPELRKEINSLRAEVEVARGLMRSGQGPVEDPLKLRSELNEARKNVEIAVRLRTKAEGVSSRLRDERDTLQKQVGNNMNLGVPVATVAPDREQDGRAVFAAKNVKKRRLGAVAMKTLAAVAEKRSVQSEQAETAAWRRAARIIGLGVIVIVALEFGFSSGVGLPVNIFTWLEQKSAVPSIPDRLVAPTLGDSRVIGEPSELSAIAVTEQVVEPLSAEINEPVVIQKPAFAKKITDISDLLKSFVGPLPWRQESSAVVSAPAEGVLPEPVQQPEPPRQVLKQQGSFRDNLKDGGVAPLMVKLPAADFMMGSQGKSLNFDEGPLHTVSLPRFSISKYELTFTDYDLFARATGTRLPYDESWGRGDRPVINVSWKDAQAYVVWLSAQTGHTYRLPSESQWEFAARAGLDTSHPWDEDSDAVPANCFDCGSEWDQSSTSAVGSFPANHFGLFDMGGNVQEWTEDCYRAGYNGATDDGAALQISGCTQHAVRGGAYTSPVNSLRSSSRGQYDQDTRLDNLGFRIVRKY